jgi:hypothetical protein
MRAVVVYESMFGNTERVARAIGQGLEALGNVQVIEVNEAPAHLDDIDLLVVGGPTHAFGMSRARTREDAGRQAEGRLVSQHLGIREWLPTLPSAAVAAAAFDTRVAKVRRLPGSAARGAARLLSRHRYRLVVPPESFYVDDVTGPLLQGELDRAREWGNTLATALAESRRGTSKA